MSWEPINPDKPSDTELIGDEPFDIVADTLDAVVACYLKDLQRKPTAIEIVKTIERAWAPRFSDTALEGETSELLSLSCKTKAIPRRQKYAVGDVLRTKAANGEFVYARLFEIGDMGPAIGVYDSLGFIPKKLEDLRGRRLLVRVTPIHRELLQERQWTVVGNLPITAIDRKQPKGPAVISGVNEQLKAVNHHYGFKKLTGYQAQEIERWLIRK